MLKKADKEVVCVAHFTAKAGSEDELLRELHSLISPTSKEQGYIRYELNQGTDNPGQIVFVEKFASREAFDSHCTMPYIKKFFADAAPRLVESQIVTLYKEVLP
jgi:quinol monooxygenase YgiN